MLVFEIGFSATDRIISIAKVVRRAIVAGMRSAIISSMAMSSAIIALGFRKHRFTLFVQSLFYGIHDELEMHLPCKKLCML